jgi:hypothetical protein
MTLAFLVAGVFEVVTGLALRPAARAGRLILMAGGFAGVLVAASPEPAADGDSMRHMVVAAIGLVALAAWPAAARRRGPSVPWGLRPVVSAGASLVLTGVLLWFVAELVTGGGLAGLAERLLGGLQTLWPVLVIVSCRLSRPRAKAPGRSGSQVSPTRTEIFEVTPQIAEHQQRFSRLISHRVPFSDAGRAFQLALTPGAAEKWS